MGWLLLGSGDSGGDGATTALQLSTETISVARGVAEDTGRLAESVEAAGPTSDLVGVFEGAEAKAAGLAGQTESELGPDDPGRAGPAPRRAQPGGGLRPTGCDRDQARRTPGASARAREAKRAMNRALNGLDAALEALRTAFVAEGAAEAAESVEDSLAQLRDSRPQLIAPFDALTRGL